MPLFLLANFTSQGVVAQGWSYVDNELHRMERHPAQAVKPGFQSRREVGWCGAEGRCDLSSRSSVMSNLRKCL